jgi:IstB-like ATP binding protein
MTAGNTFLDRAGFIDLLEPPYMGKTHLAVVLAGKVVKVGRSVSFYEERPPSRAPARLDILFPVYFSPL